jgi:hypothetical protein
MRKTIPFVLTALALAAQPALAQKPAMVDATVAAGTAPGKAAIVSQSEINATVVSIDKSTRTVVLKGPKGKTKDIVAGPEVRNFDQIKVGDNVAVQFTEALTLELKKTSAPLSMNVTTGAARAPQGAAPGAAVGREVTVLANVVAVDQAKSSVSLKGPHGNVIDLKVQDPAQFKLIKVGDQVEAVYTEALAIAVTPAAAKK